MPTDDPGPADVVEVGRVGRAHGVRGELTVTLITDREERLAPGTSLRVGDEWLVVAAARHAGNRWLVSFEGVVDRTAAERRAHRTLWAAPLDDRGEGLYVVDLIGADVVEVGTARRRGRCVAVIDNPAHELLELDSGALVPVVFVVAVADGVITIDPPEGLFDLV